MTKSDFIRAVAGDCGETMTTVERVLLSMKEVVFQELRNDGDSTIPGVVKLQRVTRAERKGVNPATGEKLTIAARKAVKAKVLKPFETAAG